MSFFHGTEVTDIASKIIAIAQVNSSTIALIGTSPDGPPGMSLVASPVDQAQFGPSVFDGRTIPHALDAIFAQGASRIIVINVAAPKHLVAVLNEAAAVGNANTFPIANVPVGAIIVKTDDVAKTLLVKGVDYLYKAGDKFITILNTAQYPPTTGLTISYSYFNPALVLANDVIGGIAGNERTGIALLDLAYSRYGLTPKIIIAPVHVEAQTVCNALLLQAEKLRARVLVDAPNGTTRDGAVSSRGPAGNYDNFNTNNKRVVCMHPYVYKPDPLDSTIPGNPFPLSAYYAGVWAASINRNGIKQSPSNLVISGVKKLVSDVSCGIGDRDSDASILNAAGISTVYTGFGSGVRLWGNRNALFPSSADISTFLSVQLTQDVIDESIQSASLEFQDRPLNLALIDTIISSVNGFLNTLQLSGDIIDGEATYDPNVNTPEQLATGKIIIDVRWLSPTPSEWILFRSFIDISIFSQLV